MNIEYAFWYAMSYLQMHLDQVVGIFGIGAVIVSALLMARRDLRASAVSLVSHSLWFTNGWLTSNWALVVLNVILTGLTCYTWWNFTKHREWK